MTHELSIEKEIDFMIKYGLTSDELFLIKLIFYAQEDHPELIVRFFTNNSLGTEIQDLLVSLQRKGIINKTYTIPKKGMEFEPKDVEFNERVIKSFYQHSQDLGMELFEHYPTHTIINGQVFSLRNIAKNFKTFDEFCWQYGKIIKFDVEKHHEILALLEYGKDNNFIKSGICDFVISQQWLTLQALQNGDLEIFNTNELI